VTLRRTIAFLLLAMFAAPGSARADEEITKRMWFAENKGKLVVSTSFTELFDKDAYKALSSGFDTTVILRAYVYEKETGVPVAFTMATLRAIYDLWDEEYRVRIVDARGKRNWKFKSKADALKAMTEIDSFPLAKLGKVTIGEKYYCEMTVELNPVSEERLAEMRRWLTKRAGSTSIDSSSSFFGSFVSVFVNPKLQGADNVIKLTSQPFYRVDE
jgi:hypothetical protein